MVPVAMFRTAIGFSVLIQWFLGKSFGAIIFLGYHYQWPLVGFPIYREAWENLLKRRMTMELSMTIALLSALAIGQFFTAIVIAFFVLFAELLEGYRVGGGRRAIEKLVNTLPRRVTVRRDGRDLELSTESFQRGVDSDSSRRKNSSGWNGGPWQQLC